MTDKRYRDARTGEYVTAEYAAEHPDTTVNDTPQTIKHTLRLPLGVLVDDEWKEIGVVEVPATLHVNTVHGRTLASMKPVAGHHPSGPVPHTTRPTRTW